MSIVLITGCAGFLGSHLSQRHLDEGDEVWGVDDFCSSSPLSPHLLALAKNKWFRLINQDVCVLDRVMRLKQVKFDVVLNFACPASPPRYMKMPVKTMMTCVQGTKNVLDIARRCGARVVHASTSEIYGDPAESPQRESYKGNVNTWGPRAVYDEGKRAAEALCYEYLKTGLDVRVVRLFNTYGPNMDLDDGRVITNTIVSTLKSDDINVYGTGDQTRSLCYVSDVVEAISKLLVLSSNPGEPLNLGNDDEMSVNDIVRLVLELVPDSSSKVVHVPAWQDDPMQRCPDLSKIKKLLNWRPTTQTKDGLTKTIKYVKSRLQ